MSLPWVKSWGLLNKHKAEQLIRMQDKDMSSQTFLVPNKMFFIQTILPPQTVPKTKVSGDSRKSFNCNPT